ncbi:hypothetical protein [Prescottella equi]|uniref:hypothetical protein n=1 Tax=Rhodococcus hoagii TaxID=43767 RepID=UPI001A027F41|nr:hypothetical protein [Prescottella equi]MBM4498189.1 hypothetical protein [Prescottella equi]MBM4498255.1 hypothetical protein [Prescottella equi]MBP0094974.1 hypothetical protein [Prescottella equi]NKV40693.1 hypothetical protein [Prescottella equi]
MSTRDELANLIAQADSQEVGAMDPRTVGTMYGHIADAILAAGYSRPRVVETVEDAAALPDGSVILHEGMAYQASSYVSEAHPDGYICWECHESWRGELGHGDILPATVIHLPEEKP